MWIENIKFLDNYSIILIYKIVEIEEKEQNIVGVLDISIYHIEKEKL